MAVFFFLLQKFISSPPYVVSSMLMCGMSHFSKKRCHFLQRHRRIDRQSESARLVPKGARFLVRIFFLLQDKIPIPTVPTYNVLLPFRCKYVTVKRIST